MRLTYLLLVLSCLTPVFAADRSETAEPRAFPSTPDAFPAIAESALASNNFSATVSTILQELKRDGVKITRGIAFEGNPGSSVALCQGVVKFVGNARKGAISVTVSPKYLMAKCTGLARKIQNDIVSRAR